MKNVKKIKIEAFCKIFKEFLNELYMLYPEDKSLSLLSTAVNTMAMVTPEILVFQFMEYIQPYTDKILQRDSTFFLNEFEKDIPSDSFIQEEINKVRELWPEASDITKDCIWKYLESFIKLGNSILKH
ncbi:MAG TPA: hypothetical protein V6C58_05745 [Allocoleopsis sp.]